MKIMMILVRNNNIESKAKTIIGHTKYNDKGCDEYDDICRNGYYWY